MLPKDNRRGVYYKGYTQPEPQERCFDGEAMLANDGRLHLTHMCAASWCTAPSDCINKRQQRACCFLCDMRVLLARRSAPAAPAQHQFVQPPHESCNACMQGPQGALVAGGGRCPPW